jgi:hypothetical protein
LNSSIYFLAVDSDFLRRVDGQTDLVPAYANDNKFDIRADHNPFAAFPAQN